jgi:hypothetical protein
MKKIIPTRKITGTTLLCCSLLSASLVSVKPTRDNINTISKTDAPAIIKTGIRKGEILIKATNGISGPINIVVFDTSWSLIAQRTLKAKQLSRVSGLRKGEYMYSVFHNGEEIFSGKFLVHY